MTERERFEIAIWDYYQNLKAAGWSDPAEGDNVKEALFWRHESGRYGVAQIEAAWWGWEMRSEQ